MSRSVIECGNCGEPCGRSYSATGPTYDSGGEPGFAEGIGENFSLNGIWFCSQDCLDIYKQERDEDQEVA